MKYSVTTYEEETTRYYFTVEADSEEQAEDKVRSGEVDCEGRKHVSGEIISMEIKEIPDESQYD